MRSIPLVLLALSVSCNASKQAVTPQRPSLSADTAITAEGTFEIEAGINIDPRSSFDLQGALKYGTSENTELFLGWSPLQILENPGEDIEGTSDLLIGARHRLWDEGESTPSGAIVVTGKVPTGGVRRGLSTGEIDLRVGAILNQQFGEINANAFYQYGALGDPNQSGTVSEHSAALTAGWMFDEKVGGFVELAGIFVPSQDLDSLFVISGLTYAVSPSLVLDAGVTTGLSSDAPDLQIFVGFTQNLGGVSVSPQR